MDRAHRLSELPLSVYVCNFPEDNDLIPLTSKNQASSFAFLPPVTVRPIVTCYLPGMPVF